MAKALAVTDSKLAETVKTQALALLKQAFTEARDGGVTPTKEGVPPLFPNGVELIHVKFELALSEFARGAVELDIAGPRPPSTLGGA